MSKIVHYINIPMITNNDFTPLFDALEDIGFTIDTTNNRAYWKDSGIFLNLNSSYAKINNANTSDIDFASSYRLTSYSTKLYYIKFNEKSIALGFVPSNDLSSTGYFTTYIVEPDAGETKWCVIGPTKYAYDSGNAKSMPYYLCGRLAYMSDSFIIVPTKLNNNNNPFNLKNTYIVVYGPNRIKSLGVGYIGNKQYLVAYNTDTNTAYAPFAIDVDAIWDDEDY